MEANWPSIFILRTTRPVHRQISPTGRPDIRGMRGQQFNERGVSIVSRVIASGSGGYGVIEYRDWSFSRQASSRSEAAYCCFKRITGANFQRARLFQTVNEHHVGIAKAIGLRAI